MRQLVLEGKPGRPGFISLDKLCLYVTESADLSNCRTGPGQSTGETAGGFPDIIYI